MKEHIMVAVLMLVFEIRNNFELLTCWLKGKLCICVNAVQGREWHSFEQTS